ncbi:hypothetical protein F5Y17DRAFT_452957 [Xylariaceae sp. FL0594]|nr:hypothetical protein F5Y17DRAFT_452957 [Xylariaceae sp. FL0594]
MVIPVTGTDTPVQRLYDIPVFDAYDEDLGRGVPTSQLPTVLDLEGLYQIWVHDLSGTTLPRTLPLMSESDDKNVDDLDYLGLEMGGQNSDYLGSLPSQAYSDKTDPAQWPVEMPPSPGMALQTQPSSLELFYVQEIPASVNQMPNDFALGRTSGLCVQL